MKNLKRTLAMMLVLCMVFGLLPVGVSAAVELGTTGTVVGEPFDDNASLSDNSPQYTNYRIPGLVMLNDGTLVAAADIRYDYEYDGGGSDIVVSTSTDKGENWNYSVVAYLGDNGNVHAKNSSTMMDPLLITDGENLYLLYDLFPAGFSLGGGDNTTYAFSATGTGFNSNGKMVLSTSYNSTDGGYYLDGKNIYDDNGNVQPNYTVDEWFNVYQNGTYVSNLFFADSPFYAYPTSYIAMQTSSDGGDSWSDPELVNIKHEGTSWQVLGPGSGIVTQNGELAFTVYNQGGSIDLVHGKSGDWTTVRTYAATNESSIVELSDGTIRAFVKNDSNVITYVDFALNEDGTYTAGSAVSTGVSNTGWCMISSTMYSRGINEDDVILVCCPASSGLRRYGTVYAFTVDPETNAMSKAGSWQIDTGYDDQFFAYSDMQELEDGRIAMLYEDGCLTYSSAPWSGSAAGIGYSHIKYITFDPAEKLGLTFDEDEDIMVWTFDNAQGEIQLGASAGVTHIHAEPTTVDSITEAHLAYDIHLCTEGDENCTDCSSCTKGYTGSATVTLPLTEELQSAAQVKGFVVESDGTVTSVYDVENDGEYVTFVAPHFSVVGIAAVTADEVAYSKTENVILDVGQSVTYTDETGNYEPTYTGTGLNTKIATVTVTGQEAVAETTVSTTAATTLEAGASYLIVVNGTDYALTSNTGSTAWGTSTLAFEYGKTTATDANTWTLEADGSGYKLKSAAGYLCLGSNNNTGYVDSTGETFTITQGNGTWTAGNAYGKYINALGGVDHYRSAGGWTTGTDLQFYKVEQAVDASTTITITGESVGSTAVVVGETKYNITVMEDRYITIPVGYSKTDVLEDVSYSMADVTEGPDTDIATLDSVTATTPTLIPVTAIESGKQYLIVNKATGNVLTNTAVSATGAWEDKYGLDTTGTASADSTELWTITSAADGKYTVTQDNKYLTVAGFYAAVSDTVTNLTLTYTGSAWRIYDDETTSNVSGVGSGGYYLSDNVGNDYDEAALGTNDTGNGYRDWIVYEIDAGGDTEVTFTGVSVGTTTATIGGYTYHITVEDVEKDIKLHVGESKTFTIDGYQYTMDNVTTAPDASIAKLDSVVPADAKLVSVSEIVSGEKYLIVNSQTGEVLTDTAVTLTGDAGEKSALVTEGTASIDSTELWTITGSDAAGYTVVQDGKYLTVAGYYAAMSSTATALKLTYSPSGWMICDDTTWQSLNHDNADYYLRNGIADAGYSTDALGSSLTSSYSYWKIYKIDDAPVTEVTFTGVKAGTTTAKVGHVTYNITVDNVIVGNISDFNNIVGVDQYSDDNANTTYRSDLDMAGKKVTSLRISEGASFHLGVDVTEYESVTWTIADPTIATVDADGNVTAVKAGVTEVTATVIKNSVEESITIPVTVVPSMVEGYADSQITSIFYYIEQVDDTDPYYTMFLNTESTTDPVEGHRLVKVSEGEVIWYERPTNSAFAWVWTADPWEGYALTKMGSSGSIDEYYPLRNVNDITQLGDGNVDTDGDGTADTEYYYTSASFSSNGAPNNAYKNVVLVGNDASASWRDALDELLEESILIGQNVWPNYGCDGAMSNTRWDHDGVPKLVTAMTFISDPMPQIEKSVNGILPTTGLRKDFRLYTDGMLATVGEYVYFEVSITVDRPTIWTDEANGIGAITYTDAIVTDTVLDGAYFYVQTKDTNNNGLIDPGEGEWLQTEDITARLNAAWGAEEKTRTIDLYLVYVITNDDMEDNRIDNTAGLTWKYQSHYSKGSLSGSADAAASIYVVGQTLDDVVIDFGQSIAYEGLTDSHLDSDSEIEANYGDVSIQKVYTDSTDESKGYTYTITYTPTEILQAPDAVLIYGKNTDGSRKLINGFVVYPATTVYYEEGFMLDGNSGWVTTNAKDATKNQEFELLNKTSTDADGNTVYVSDKTYAYGFDPIYATGSVEKSEISTNVTGAKTSFTFTGTGFELFANSTTETGWILVEVDRPDGSNAKMFMVDTAATAGNTGATSGQATDLDSLPIVSIKDLEHGTYTVSLRKLRADDKTVIIDGVRIVNTVEDSSVFNIDLEDNPDFYQLRDMVLNALGVKLYEKDENGDVIEPGTSVDYKNMCDQVYNAIDGASAIITSESVDYANSSTLQDLLDNGPKNELYLWAGQKLTFSVTSSRALQIGLKAPAGETSYSLSYTVDGTTKAVADTTMTSTEDLFYALGNDIGTEQTYTITVTNNGANILSVTDLKICDDPSAAFAPLQEADIRNILLAAGYVDPDATDEPEEPVVPTADAVLNIVLVDYTGKRLSTAQLVTSGPANSTAVFTAEEIMAAAKMPKGYDFADTVSEAAVICGTSGTVTIRAGKVATLKVTYVNVFGKTVGTATFTKVQTSAGFFSVTAEQIKNAAPEGRTALWLTGAMAAYGRETNLIVPVL